MTEQPDLESLPREDRIILAIQATKSNASLSQRRPAALYNVPQSTLSNRHAKTAARRECHDSSSRLQRHEEEAIIHNIRKLDSRGFDRMLSYVSNMADQLLAARGGGKVGENWASNLVRRKPEVKSQVNRLHDHQGALCSNPAIISPWFDLVRNVKAKYGILDEDNYNFDEFGFMMGVISTGAVVTGSERRGRPKTVQQGDREWTSIIQGIYAKGWAIQPFITVDSRGSRCGRPRFYVSVPNTTLPPSFPSPSLVCCR